MTFSVFCRSGVYAISAPKVKSTLRGPEFKSTSEQTILDAGVSATTKSADALNKSARKPMKKSAHKLLNQ